MKRILFLIITATFLINSCNRKTEKVGPNICPSDDFKSTPLTHASTVNLSDDSVAFASTFNESIDWTLEVRGNTSKAFKRYTGRSKEIAITWYGNADTALFFELEMCTVSLTFSCSTPIVSQLQITGLPSFENVDGMYLLWNFEGGGPGAVSGTSGTYDTYNAIVVSPSDPSPQGGNYYRLSGAAPQPEYYFGAMDGANVNFPDDWTNPNEIYLNMFLNSDGITNSEMAFAFGEQGVGFRKVINWTGWKMVSTRLVDMEIRDPQVLSTFGIGLGSAPLQGSSATAKIDFIIFTKGKPFLPEE